MNIQITHTIEIGENTKTFLTALVASLAGSTPMKAPEATAGSTKSTRTTKPKDNPTNNGGEGAGSSDNSNSSADGVITFDMLKERFAEVKAKGKNDNLKALLKENNVAALSGLQEAQYKYFYDEAGKFLN